MRQLDALGAAAALNDPVRQRLLRFVSTHDRPVTRDVAAAALDMPRSTVAFHLDRLADAGLLAIEYQRINGRDGPGAGRPSKTYSRVVTELAVSIPERHYDLMGDLLATAIENATDAMPAAEALRVAATIAGREAGDAAKTVEQLLDETGYEPTTGRAGTELRNCPFHRLARRHTELVCAANRAFLSAAVESTGGDPASVLLEPSASGCCIRIES